MSFFVSFVIVRSFPIPASWTIPRPDQPGAPHGKSRYLGLLGTLIGHAQSAKSIAGGLEQAIDAVETASDNAQAVRRQEQRVESMREQFRNHQAEMKSESADLMVSLLPMSLAFNHSNIIEPDSQTNAVKHLHMGRISVVSIEEVFPLQWIYCDTLAERIYDAEHPKNSGDESLALEMAEVERFNTIAGKLLRTKLDARRSPSTRRPIAYLWNRPLDPRALSYGQRVLLTWTIYLTVKSTLGDQSGLVVTLDEPESHLHPDALISVVSRLRDLVVPNGGQLWIATHSPTLVSHLYGDASIYHVHDNKVDYADSRMDELYHG